MADPLARWGRKDKLISARQKAGIASRRGGIVGYRTIKPRPDRIVRIAILRRPGPRGGRTVATSLFRKKSTRR